MKVKGAVIGICIADLILLVIVLLLYMRQDRTGPVISFTENEVTWGENMDLSLLLNGVSALDAVDGDVSDTLLIEKISDTSGGDVIVTYAALDRSDNVAKATRIFPSRLHNDSDASAENRKDREKKTDPEEGSLAEVAQQNGETDPNRINVLAGDGNRNAQEAGGRREAEDEHEARSQDAEDRQNVRVQEAGGRRVAEDEQEARGQDTEDRQNVRGQDAEDRQSVRGQDTDDGQNVRGQDTGDRPVEEDEQEARGQDAGGQPEAEGRQEAASQQERQEQAAQQEAENAMQEEIPQENQAPVLQLSKQMMTVSKGAGSVNWNECIGSLSDDSDSHPQLFSNIVMEGHVDLNTPGDFTVYIYTKDSQGLESEKQAVTLRVE